MNTTTPEDFMVTYFGTPDRWDTLTLEAFAAELRGDIPTFNRHEKLQGQDRLDAWALTEASTRQAVKVEPVTTDYQELLAWIEEETADED